MFKKSPLKSIFFLAGITLVSLFIASCGSKEEAAAGTSTADDFEKTTDTVSSEVRSNFDLIRVNIPKPSELTAKLAAAKIGYNKSVLLPSSKAGSFSSNYSKAIGMGVFSADLGHAAAYNQTQDAMEYLNQITKLSGDLGIVKAFDPEFAKDILASVSKPDTFQMKFDEAFDKAERNLRSNQRVAITVLMVTGGWVESLYLSVEGLSVNPTGGNTTTLYSDISIHCNAFSYVFELLEAYKTNADCAKLMKEMEPYKPTLLSFGKSGWGATGLPKLKETVTALRNKIVN